MAYFGKHVPRYFNTNLPLILMRFRVNTKCRTRQTCLRKKIIKMIIPVMCLVYTCTKVEVAML